MDASPLAGWENFYVIIGSSAGGLTGLTFVVVALLRDFLRESHRRASGLGGYITPTIVHFAGVLALAAFLSMPHQGVASLSVGLVLGGLTGVIYCMVVARRIAQHGQYVAVREDWIWNVVLPILDYGGLTAAGVLIWDRPILALYVVGVLSLLLLFIGIRNAWDIAVWMTVTAADTPKSEGESAPRQ